MRRVSGRAYPFFAAFGPNQTWTEFARRSCAFRAVSPFLAVVVTADPRLEHYLFSTYSLYLSLFLSIYHGDRYRSKWPTRHDGIAR